MTTLSIIPPFEMARQKAASEAMATANAMAAIHLHVEQSMTLAIAKGQVMQHPAEIRDKRLLQILGEIDAATTQEDLDNALLKMRAPFDPGDGWVAQALYDWPRTSH